jgi:hypothetical protein
MARPVISSNFLKFQRRTRILFALCHLQLKLSRKNTHKKEYWQNELQSLGIEPKRQNELNDKAELEALAESIKLVYFQDYKTAYGSNNNG